MLTKKKYKQNIFRHYQWNYCECG